MFCGKCGKQVDENNKFCPYCGTAIESNDKGKKDTIPILIIKTILIYVVYMNICMILASVFIGVFIGFLLTLPFSYEEYIYPYDSTKYEIIASVSTQTKESQEEQFETETETEASTAEIAFAESGTTANNSGELEVEETFPEESFPVEEASLESEYNLTSEYILPDCDTRVYSREELQNLSRGELRLARNEIYARHGRKFSAEDLNAYFSSKSWYSPLYEGSEIDQAGDSILNQNEIANRDLIVELEAEKVDE